MIGIDIRGAKKDENLKNIVNKKNQVLAVLAADKVVVFRFFVEFYWILRSVSFCFWSRSPRSS